MTSIARLPDRLTAFATTALAVFTLSVSLQAQEPAEPGPTDTPRISLEDLLSQRDTGGEWIPLFNGRDFTGFYTHLQKLGKNEDPDKIYQVSDGVIHLFKDVEDGKPMPYGGFITEKEYGDYHLRFDYRWGTKKYPPRHDKARDSGLLYHVVGPDDAFGGGAWARSLECQVIENGTGDYYGVGTWAFATVTEPDSKTAAIHSEHIVGLGQADKVSRIGAAANHEREGWNTVEVIARGDASVHLVNGHPVLYLFGNKIPDPENPGKWIPLTKGRLWFQAEGAEIQYRNIDIRHLPPVEVPGVASTQITTDTMIRHTVVFTLKHPAGSPEEKAFLDAAQELAKIPSVRRFERLREVSKKNDYAFGLSMEFEDQAGYDAYNEHPDHVRFVQEQWIPHVKEFMEIDYVPYP